MFISSCGIILNLFYLALFCVVQEDELVDAGVLSVPSLGYGAVILRATLGGYVSIAICVGDICNTLGGSPGLFM